MVAKTSLGRTPDYTTGAASRALSVSVPSAGWLLIQAHSLAETFSGNSQALTPTDSLSLGLVWSKDESEGVISGQTPHHSVSHHWVYATGSAVGNITLSTADANGSIINFEVFHFTNCAGVGYYGNADGDGTLGAKTVTLSGAVASTSIVMGIAQQPSNNTLSNTSLTVSGTDNYQWASTTNPGWLPYCCNDTQSTTGVSTTTPLSWTTTVLNYDTRVAVIEMKDLAAPAGVATPYAWFDVLPANMTLASGNHISQFTDRTGKGNHATQSTDANRPIAYGAYRKGYAGARFDGSSDYVSLATPVAPSAISVFIVAADRSATSTNGGIVGNPSSVSGSFEWKFSSTDGHTEIVRASTGSDLSSSSTYTKGSCYRFGFTANASTLNLYFNGQVAGTASGSFSYAGTGVGDIGRAVTTGEYASMDVYEIIIYDRVLSANEIATLDNYLRQRWFNDPGEYDYGLMSGHFVTTNRSSGITGLGARSGTGRHVFPAQLVGSTTIKAATEGTPGSDNASRIINTFLWGNDAVSAQPATASGTGTAFSPSETAAPVAGLASGTGTAYTPTISTSSNVTNAPAGNAAGTGSAGAPTITVAPVAGVASGTGAAGAPTPTVNPTAGVASGTGSAGAPTPTVLPNAGLASGTGAAGAPTPTVKPNAGLASGTGAAGAPTLTEISNASAGVASGTGAALPPAITALPNAGLASGAGAAFGPTLTLVSNAAAGVASGSGAAFSAVITIAPSLAAAAGSGAALAPIPTVKVMPSVASGTGQAFAIGSSGISAIGGAAGTGAALTPSVLLLIPAGAATGSGAALTPTINLTALTEAQAGNAAGTGQAFVPTTTMAPVAGAASGSGTAFGTSVTLLVPAGAALGSGSALAPTMTSLESAPAASGTGTAFAAAVNILTSAGLAAGTGAAPQPTALTGLVVPAGVASGSGQAFAPLISIFVAPAAAQGAGTAFQPHVLTLLPLAMATGTGVALQPSVYVQQPAAAALGSGQAFDPSITIAVLLGLAVAVGEAFGATAKIGLVKVFLGGQWISATAKYHDPVLGWITHDRIKVYDPQLGQWRPMNG